MLPLLLVMAGCADDSLVGGIQEDPARLGVMTGETVQQAVGDDRVLFMGEGRFQEAVGAAPVRCVDTDGNRVPGLFVFAEATVAGRFFYLDEMTGVFTRERCVLDAAGALTLAGAWRFTGGDSGESIWGTYTATVSLADGSFTHKESIADGTGRFAGATGWIRGHGTIRSGGSEDGLFQGKGLITRPRPVTSRGFVLDATLVSEDGVVGCVDPEGNPLPVGSPEQFTIEGLSTYLGRTVGVFINERCRVDSRGVPLFSGTWTLTGAQGNGLHGTYTAQFSLAPRIRIEMVITGGTGPFERASGWIRGFAPLRPDGFDAPLEGLIFLPG